MHAGILPPPKEGGFPKKEAPPLGRRTPLPRRPLGKEALPSRPTPKGEIEGDQVQAHTQGGNLGESDPGPHQRGKLRGIRSRPPPPPTHTHEKQTPAYGNEWPVRILLECILVMELLLSCRTVTKMQ